MMRRAVPLLIALAAPAMLAGCALQPMYGGGSHGAVASTLTSISIAPIRGEAGWLVRGALRDRLRVGEADANARYRIDVALDDDISGYGVRADDTVTRERRSLRARWQLVDAQNGTTLVDATAASDTGIDVVSSEYATIAAERSALERLAEQVADQIVTRVAVYARSDAARAQGVAAGAAPPAN